MVERWRLAPADVGTECAGWSRKNAHTTFSMRARDGRRPVEKDAPAGAQGWWHHRTQRLSPLSAQRRLLILVQVSSSERFLARTQRRRRRGAHIALAVAVGFAAAIGVALIAGSRRSSSVVDRYVAAAPRYDVMVFSQAPQLTPTALAALPGVTRAAPTPYIAFALRGVDPSVGSINSTAADFTEPNRTARVLRGHVPDGSQPFEVVVNEAFADGLHLDVGDNVPVRTYAIDQYDELTQGIYAPRGPSYDFVIAAVARGPGDIALQEVRTPRLGAQTSGYAMLVSEQFWTAHHSDWIDFGSTYNVRLSRGQAGIEDFLDSVHTLVGDAEVSSQPWTLSENVPAFRQPVTLETGALLAVGIGAAAGAVLVALVLLRFEQRGFESEHEALRSIGMTTGSLVRSSLMRVAPAALAAAVVVGVGAIAASSRFPIGLGRQLELNPGIDVNVAVVGAGVVGVGAVVLGLAAVVAWLPARRRRRRRTHTSPITGRLPFGPSLGARLALRGADGTVRGSTTTGIAIVGVALGTVVAVGMWLDGTQHLYATPAARGWVWDIAIGNVNFPLDPSAAAKVTGSPLVSSATGIAYGQATIDNASVEVLGYDPNGTAPPQLVRGRLPVSPNEAALGAGLMRRFHVGIGGTITLSAAGSEFVDNASSPDLHDVTLNVVGETAAPPFGESDIADIAVVPLSAIAATGGDAAPRLVLANVVGPNRAASIEKLIAPLTEEVHNDIISAQVVNTQRVRRLPLLGLLLAAAIGLIVLVATTIAASRSNRRSLAVLHSIGLDRATTRRIVTWQGAITALVAIAIGISLGAAAGTLWWRNVADSLGVRDVIPFAPVAFAVSLAAIAAVAVTTAQWTGRQRRRVTIAEALRTE